MQRLTLVLEIIGTVAFSVSGAITGIRKGVDMLGVAALGLITAVGGGIIRDVLIGVTPPTAFVDPLYALIAIVVALIVFLPFISRKIDLNRLVWVIIDALGLAAFTMIGVTTDISSDNLFLEVFLGVTTGVGGGVIRDICVGKIPSVFVRFFYASPCIIGALLCAVLYRYNETAAVLTGFFSIVILRIFAAIFKWELPKARSSF